MFIMSFEAAILMYITFCLIVIFDEYGFGNCLIFLFKGIFLLLLYTVGVPIMFVIMVTIDIGRKIFCKKDIKESIIKGKENE